MAMQIPNKAPSSTARAAGIGGVLAGVPIGTYLGNIAMALLAAYKPEFIEALQSVAEIDLVHEFQAAISGLITVAVTFLIAWSKKEQVYEMRERDA